jgi:tRNA G18 (ribose-2'-O)-methylase SpoU
MSDIGRWTSITDPGDPRISEYRDIRDKDLLGRDGRPGRFIGEAPLILEVMLDLPDMTRSVLVSEGQAERVSGMIAASRSPGTPLFVASSDVMNGIVGFDIHRGVLASGNRPDPLDRTLEKVLPEPGRPATILVCDGINNIDNIGLLFRNAAAFGVDAVILSPDCHDPLYRKSIRVSSGHALRIPFHRSVRWPETLDALRSLHGIELIGTSIAEGSSDIDEVMPPERVGIVMGGEFEGLGPEAITACDRLVRIPMTEGTDSLNVGVAAAVALHRFSRAYRV